MRSTCVLSVTILVGLSLCIYIPAPALTLLPLTLAAAELSWVLLLLDLLALLLSVRFCRRAAPFALLAALLSAFPVFQAATLQLRPQMSWPPEKVTPRHLPLNILFYPARKDNRKAAVIDIYGGAWQRGAPAVDSTFDSYLAHHGIAVFAVDYRHAPSYQFPAQLQDVQAGLRYIYANADAYGVDRNRLFLCGRSSGAQLALLAAYLDCGVPVQGVIAYYPPADLVRGYSDVPVPDPIHVRAVLEAYLGGSPSQKPEAYALASPVNAVRSNLPPTLVIQGGHDHIVKKEFAIELAERLRSNGDQVTLLMLPWAEHSFDLVFLGLGNQVSLPYVERFLQKEIDRIQSNPPK